MLDIFIQRDFLGQFIHISIDSCPDITALLCMIQNLLMAALFPAHYRSKKLNLCSFRQLHDRIHHLIHSLLLYLSSAFRTVRNSDSRIEQTEVIINLRHGSDRGTRIPVG